jgi:hypothetical protein
MSKKIDVIVNRGKYKKSKGPSKELKTYTKEPIKVSQEVLSEVGGMIDDDKMFILKPVDNNNRGLLQASYWIVNGNQVKARQTLKGLGVRSKRSKAYIESELDLLRKFPKKFEHLINKPMPKEYEFKELN